MNACPPSLSAKLTLMILTVILTTVGQAGPGAAADLPGLTLPPVDAFGLRARCRRKKPWR